MTRAWWYSWLLALVVAAAGPRGARAGAWAAPTGRRRRPVVALLAPTMPWLYGPYQRQAYLLSLELHKKGVEVR